MIFMSILKVIFVLLLCVPIVYLMFFLLVKMIDEVLKQHKSSERKRNRSDRREFR